MCIGLKSLLREGLSEPEFYGDLVYKLKKIVGSNNFSAQLIEIISHYVIVIPWVVRLYVEIIHEL